MHLSNGRTGILLHVSKEQGGDADVADVSKVVSHWHLNFSCLIHTSSII